MPRGSVVLGVLLLLLLGVGPLGGERVAPLAAVARRRAQAEHHRAEHHRAEHHRAEHYRALAQCERGLRGRWERDGLPCRAH